MYQRPYSWVRSNLETLVTDFEVELSKPKKGDRTLFLGTIVFNVEGQDDHETVDLIDGQQRLVTLSLVQNWWLKFLDDFQDNKAGAAQAALRELLFNEELDEDDDLPEGALRNVLRLVPSAGDRDAYESVIRRGKGPGPGRYRIATAYKILGEQFESMLLRRAKKEGIDPELDPEGYQKIVIGTATAIKDLLSQRITFGVIEVREPLNPFSVFESLNSKGLALAASDLVKNFMLKQLPEVLRGEALQSWDDMVETVPQDKIVDFLRAWYIANMGHIQRSELYPAFRRLLDSKATIKNSLEEWNYAAWWYLALAKGKTHDDHPDFGTYPPLPVLSQALRRWRQLSFKQGIPVILAYVSTDKLRRGNKEGQAELAQIMGLLESAYVRLFVTRNVRGSVFEAKLDQMCSIARSGESSTIERLQTLLYSMCKDEGIDGAMDWRNVSRSIGECRHLLYRIAEHQAGDSIQLLGPEKWHVDHILPQTKPGGHPNELEKSEYQSLVSKIGNLTLLLGKDNMSLKNADYERKVKTLSLYDGASQIDDDSDPTTPDVTRPYLPMNTMIVTQWPEEWTEETIGERGEMLGKYATEVWPMNRP